MANQTAHDKMAVMWEEVGPETDINQTLSKDLNVYDPSGMFNQDKTGNANDTNFDAANTDGDRVYIPQMYDFVVQDGIVTTDSDFQDSIDRMVPANRALSFNIPATITAKELQNPSKVEMLKQSFTRRIGNHIDTVCYQKMINQASMFVPLRGTKYAAEDATDAEVTMLNRGLGSYSKKLFLSNTHYRDVAVELGKASRETFVGDAITKARVPGLATFETMRSDYLLPIDANSATGLKVNGAGQGHTVATYDSDGFFLDNRSQVLSITGATLANMPVGTKFTIDGVDAVNPATKTPNGELMTFTVIAAKAGGPTIQPAMVVDGPYQNVSAAPADEAAITILNTKKDNPTLFYTPESTVIIPGKVPVVDDGVRSIEATLPCGIPITLVYWYDANKMRYNMKAVVSMDVQVLYPDMVGVQMNNQ
tara:strand:+ start:4832 stop:6097 length:1266 start_codon:yes stop_codon:yes gene_type:complete